MLNIFEQAYFRNVLTQLFMSSVAQVFDVIFFLIK